MKRHLILLLLPILSLYTCQSFAMDDSFIEMDTIQPQDLDNSSNEILLNTLIDPTSLQTTNKNLNSLLQVETEHICSSLNEPLFIEEFTIRCTQIFGKGDIKRLFVCAVAKNCKSIVRIIIKSRHIDNYDYALVIATKKLHISIMKLLIEAGANVNTSLKGLTLLEKVAFTEYRNDKERKLAVAACKLLVGAGCSKGRAYRLSQLSNNKEISNYLIDSSCTIL